MNAIAQRLRKLLGAAALVGGVGASLLLPTSAFATGSVGVSLSPSAVQSGVATSVTATISNFTGSTSNSQMLWFQAGVTVSSPACTYVSSRCQIKFTNTIPANGSTTVTFTASMTADSFVDVYTYTGSDFTGYIDDDYGNFTVTTATPTPTPSVTPTPSSTPTPTPSTEPTAATSPSDALGHFLDIFYAVMIAGVGLIVPLFVVTWAIRLVAELMRGK